MKYMKVGTLVATSALVLGAYAVRPGVAAPPPMAPVAGITGFAPSKVAGCPNINWRLARHPDGKITGIFWYSDMSGTSEAVGSEDATSVLVVSAGSTGAVLLA